MCDLGITDKLLQDLDCVEWTATFKYCGTEMLALSCGNSEGDRGVRIHWKIASGDLFP